MNCQALNCYRKAMWQVEESEIFKAHKLCDKCKRGLAESFADSASPPVFTRLARRTWVIIREVATDEIVISSLPAGQKPTADPAYRCHGPFASKVSAERAIEHRSSTLRRVLYEDAKQFVA